jgi:hypothetical protein
MDYLDLFPEDVIYEISKYLGGDDAFIKYSEHTKKGYLRYLKEMEISTFLDYKSHPLFEFRLYAGYNGTLTTIKTRIGYYPGTIELLRCIPTFRNNVECIKIIKDEGILIYNGSEDINNNIELCNIDLNNVKEIIYVYIYRGSFELIVKNTSNEFIWYSYDYDMIHDSEWMYYIHIVQSKDWGFIWDKLTEKIKFELLIQNGYYKVVEYLGSYSHQVKMLPKYIEDNNLLF